MITSTGENTLTEKPELTATRQEKIGRQKTTPRHFIRVLSFVSSFMLLLLIVNLI